MVTVYCLLLTDNCSSQLKWRALPAAPKTTGRFDDVVFIDALQGWIIQGSGDVFGTKDGGETWQFLSEIPTGGLRSMGFVSAANGWIGTLRPANFLYSTIDSGKTWVPVQNVPQPNPGGICGISVVNDSVVYGSGYYDGTPRVIKTADGGLTWSTFDLSPFARGLVDCYFFAPDSGFVVGGVGGTFDEQRALILFTGDGGITWNQRYSGGRLGELCWKISFPNRMTGFVSIEAFHTSQVYFLKTTNGGITWKANVLSEVSRDVQGIGFVNEAIGWESGWGSPAYATTDGGETWTNAGFGVNINRFRFINDSLAYAVGQTVYKYSESTLPVGVEEDPILPLTNISLGQNYPNPFNNSTSIRYVLDRDDEIVILEIYDLLGSKIKTLFAGGQSPGEYMIEWDGTNQDNTQAASGIYIVRLRAGGFVQSQKMVLMK